MPTPRPRRRSVSLALDGWVIILSVVLIWPLLRRVGYPLARDLVFVPHQPWRAAWLGLEDVPARAVPLDALVALADQVLDGGLLARVAILGTLVIAGGAAHRALGDAHPIARVAAAGFAIWNPFVIERLALGQWALLMSYAAGLALVSSARRFREGPGGWRAAAPLFGWQAMAAVTPTGALIGATMAVVIAARRSRAHLLPIAAAAVLVQLPWLLPTLLGPASLTSDPAGVGAFAARAERPGGALWSLVGLGGIWDSGSVPSSRADALGHVGSLVVVLALLVGLPRLGEHVGTTTARRLGVLGVLGFCLAALSSLPGGDGVLRWLNEYVPGAGLLRDSQKWVLPLAILTVLALGVAADQAVRLARRVAPGALVTVGVIVVAGPIAVLPDATAATWPTVTPVVYPEDFANVAAMVDGSSQSMVTLPWTPYRVYPWGRPAAVYDPASRWFDVDVVMSDRLQVGPVLLAGESRRSAQVGALLASDADPTHLVSGVDLAGVGVRWILVQSDAPVDVETVVSGAIARYVGPHLSLYETPAPWAEAHWSPSPVAFAVVSVVDLLLLALLVVALAVGTLQTARASRIGSRPHHGLPAGMIHRIHRGR